MAKWDQALYTNKLVTTDTLKEAFSPGKLNNGKTTNYGFGWFIEPGRVYRTGAWFGYRTAILRLPKNRLSVVVLSSSAQLHPFEIAEKVSDIYLSDRGENEKRTEIRRRSLRIAEQPASSQSRAFW